MGAGLLVVVVVGTAGGGEGRGVVSWSPGRRGITIICLP